MGTSCITQWDCSSCYEQLLEKESLIGWYRRDARMDTTGENHLDLEALLYLTKTEELCGVVRLAVCPSYVGVATRVAW